MEHALLAPNWGGEEIAAINPVIAGGSVLKRGARGFHDHDVVADFNGKHGNSFSVSNAVTQGVGR